MKWLRIHEKEFHLNEHKIDTFSVIARRCWNSLSLVFRSHKKEKVRIIPVTQNDDIGNIEKIEKIEKVEYREKIEEIEEKNKSMANLSKIPSLFPKRSAK